MKKSIVIFILMFIYACQDPDTLYKEHETNWVFDADPYHDFKKAIKHGDYRFVGIYDYSLRVPGVKLSCIDQLYGVKPIEGTSDSRTSFEESKFNALAMVYAEYYNFHLRAYLEEKGLFKCNDT